MLRARSDLALLLLQATQPKWGKLINWTPRDDAALLLGVYYYGLGNWDQVAGDRHLQLTDKIAGGQAGQGSGCGCVLLRPACNSSIVHCGVFIALHSTVLGTSQCLCTWQYCNPAHLHAHTLNPHPHPITQAP